MFYYLDVAKWNFVVYHIGNKIVDRASFNSFAIPGTVNGALAVYFKCKKDAKKYLAENNICLATKNA